MYIIQTIICFQARGIKRLAYLVISILLRGDMSGDYFSLHRLSASWAKKIVNLGILMEPFYFSFAMKEILSFDHISSLMIRLSLSTFFQNANEFEIFGISAHSFNRTLIIACNYFHLTFIYMIWFKSKPNFCFKPGAPNPPFFISPGSILLI